MAPYLWLAIGMKPVKRNRLYQLAACLEVCQKLRGICCALIWHLMKSTMDEMATSRTISAPGFYVLAAVKRAPTGNAEAIVHTVIADRERKTSDADIVVANRRDMRQRDTVLVIE